MLTKKSFDRFSLRENTSFVSDVLQNILESFEHYDIDDAQTQDVIDRLFLSVEQDNSNIAIAAYKMRDDMTLGACLNLIIYCIRAWFSEGGQYTYFYMSKMWMEHRIKELTELAGNRFILLVSILNCLAKMDFDHKNKKHSLELQHHTVKLGLLLEAEDNIELSAKFYLLGVLLVEFCDYHEIALLHERLEDIALSLEDQRIKNVVLMLDRLKAVAQPGNHRDDISGVINDLKDDFIVHKENFNHQVDQAILFAIYHQLASRSEYREHYEDFKSALAF